MDNPIDRGLPFVVGDLWRSSAFQDVDVENGSIFKPLETALTSLEQLDLAKEDGSPHFEFDIELPPPLEQRILPDLQPPENAANKLREGPEGLDLGIWSLEDVTSQSEQPKLHTWEAFYNEKSAHSDGLALLSEAGPLAFDAAVSSFAPQNKLGVLPQDYTLRSLCNLALGRASSLFQWDVSKATFVPTLDGVSISGLSNLGSTSLIASLVDMGSLFARLRSFAESQPNHSRKSPAKSAVRSCVATVLSAVDESLSEELCNVRSLLQLQSLVRRPLRVLDILQKVVDCVKDARDDKNVISQISKCIDDELITSQQLQLVFETFLLQVSVPWFEQLAHSIGFPDPANALLLDNPTATNDKEFMDDMPDFVSPEDAALLRETNEAVRMLRTHSPSHPLVTDTGSDRAQSPFECFAIASFTHAQAEEYAQQYKLRNSSTKSPVQSRPATSRQPASHCRDIYDTELEDHAAYLSELQMSMSKNLQVAEAERGQLHEHTVAACRMDSQMLDSAFASLSIANATAPLDRVRALILTQHRLVNAVLLSQLFKEHHLVDHFDVQHQFHLFGNGEFVTRLSTALFSVDVQSAERRHGKVPTAETMGLRLGTTHEEQWPPASSELQLTLMGILAEAYGETIEKSTDAQSARGKLPGGLSFAIRQLPEKDIERVLDPNSIYALDFLRLQYVAKPPLDALFTTSALDSYDQIFRLLLRLLRLTHVTASLPRKALAMQQDVASISASNFIIQARTFVTVLASHMIDVGIAAPWQAFEKEIRQIQLELNQEESGDETRSRERVSMQGLRQLHDACLGRMRSRLFLKRKQEKIRAAIEEVLSTILKTAFVLQTGSNSDIFDDEGGRTELRRSIRSLHSLLQGIADKPVKDATSPDAEDADMASLLLFKLNWNGFYDEGD